MGNNFPPKLLAHGTGFIARNFRHWLPLYKHSEITVYLIPWGLIEANLFTNYLVLYLSY